MTRAEIINSARSLTTNHQHIEHLKTVVDYFEGLQYCSGCKHKPKNGKSYPRICDTCRRWYGDNYESKL